MSRDEWDTLARMRLPGADLHVADQPHRSAKVKLTATSREYGDRVEIELDAAAVAELTHVLERHRYELRLLRD